MDDIGVDHNVFIESLRLIVCRTTDAVNATCTVKNIPWCTHVEERSYVLTVNQIAVFTLSSENISIAFRNQTIEQMGAQ